MSNPKYTAEQKKEFSARRLALEGRLPHNYSAIIHQRTGLDRDIIRNTRQGQTNNMDALQALEQLAKETDEELKLSAK